MKPAPNNLFKRSLKVKFLFLLLIILSLVAFGISVVLIGYQNNRQRQLISEQAKGFAKLSVRPIGNAYDTYFGSGYLKFKEIVDETLKLDTNITRIQIIDVNGFLLYDSDNPQQTQVSTDPVAAELQALVSDDKTSVIPNEQGAAGEIIEPYFDDFAARPFSVRYFVSYELLNSSLATTIPLALGVSFLVAIVSGLLLIFTVNKTILTPIEKIAANAQSVSSGNLQARVDVHTGDELESLAASVNNMATSLQKNIEALKELDRLKDEFIIIASHNLRTPITILKGYVNQLIADVRVKPTLKNTYKAMTVSISNLEGLVEELISIVSLETERKIAAKTPVELSSLVEQSVTYNAEKALEKKVTVEFKPEKNNYKIMGDVTKLKVAFNNIIENAIKFNKEGGSVKISISEKANNFIVSISDTGIGISEKELPLVFKKFHRATDILQYNYEGLGLGLYLTRVIVEAHQGKVWFESTAGQGSTFFVGLPKPEVKGGETSA